MARIKLNAEQKRDLFEKLCESIRSGRIYINPHATDAFRYAMSGRQCGKTAAHRESRAGAIDGECTVIEENLPALPEPCRIVPPGQTD